MQFKKYDKACTHVLEKGSQSYHRKSIKTTPLCEMGAIFGERGWIHQFVSLRSYRRPDNGRTVEFEEDIVSALNLKAKYYELLLDAMFANVRTPHNHEINVKLKG